MNDILYGDDGDSEIIWHIEENAKAPEKAHSLDAGYDFFAFEDAVIPSFSQKLISTGVRWELKGKAQYFFMKIMPRSGLAVKYGIDVGAGVIDSEYRGEIKILLMNHSLEDYHVHLGDKIAQGVLFPLVQISQKITKYSEDYNMNTHRGENGFGSSGK